MAEPTFLVTNDDGIHVYFIHALAKALRNYGTTYIAAPANEQSWVGRRISRTGEVKVRPYAGIPGIQGWEVEGTPSDATNIALGHLLPVTPDVVVSGINVGWNAMLPILYSSGTVAGALEGASWGLPAIALSIHLKEDDFELVKNDSVNPPQSIKNRVDMAAELGAKFAAQKVGEVNTNNLVYNINFPTDPKPDTPWIISQPGRIKLGNLFRETETGTFRFHYTDDTEKTAPKGLPSDFEVFSQGNISLSKLNFNNLS
jgi:5'-nucleotidase